MKICLHDYKRIENPKHLKYDINGIEVVTAMCKCTKCGKMKRKKFIGHTIGNLFE